MKLNETIESVCQLLTQQQQVQESLLELAREKQRVVIENDTERLTEIISGEYRLLSRMNNIEKRRVLIMAEACAETGKAAQEITVSDLIELADAEQKLRLGQIQRSLSGALKRLKEQNDTNRTLLEAQLEYTDAMLSFIGGAGDPINNFYGTDGKSSEADVIRGSGLFDTEI